MSFLEKYRFAVVKGKIDGAPECEIPLMLRKTDPKLKAGDIFEANGTVDGIHPQTKQKITVTKGEE